MPATLTKLDLFAEGCSLLERFWILNGLEPVQITRVPSKDWKFFACAYYRPTYIKICLEKCAHPGTSGASWSWPGYTVDREPYGVLSHEFGHHIDWLKSEQKGSYFGDYSQKLRAVTREEKLTNYCPNDAEWFAEIFRLFLTNSDFLRRLRPKTYEALRVDFVPVVTDDYLTVLESAPERTRFAARKKVTEHERELPFY